MGCTLSKQVDASREDSEGSENGKLFTPFHTS